LDDKLASLQSLLVHYAAQDKIQDQSNQISKILEDQFKISARRSGEIGDVIDETALEIRTSLGNSLAAAKADRWQEAESQRLDAYTAFDTEIEPRVLPRDPRLDYGSERSFIEGDGSTPGLKALLDSRAPMDDLEAAYSRTLQNLDRCMELLKVAVSPTMENNNRGTGRKTTTEGQVGCGELDLAPLSFQGSGPTALVDATSSTHSKLGPRPTPTFDLSLERQFMRDLDVYWPNEGLYLLSPGFQGAWPEAESSWG
jgi:hypothetical protein